MIKLHHLGIGDIRLGAAINELSPIEPFGSAHRTMFIPDPGPEAWFQYKGDVSNITAGGDQSFAANFVFVAKDPNGHINRISIFPDMNSTTLVEDVLSEAYGPYGTTNGGMGNLAGVQSYKFFFFLSSEKTVQVVYYKPNSSDFGLGEITMIFTGDMEANRNYKVIYRSWAKTTE